MSWPTTSKQSRGYGAEWSRLRKTILERDCGICKCQYCKASGKVTLATEVDHVVSRAKAAALGWSKARTEAPENLQAINSDCHKRKTAEEQGGEYKPRVRIGLDGFPVE